MSIFIIGGTGLVGGHFLQHVTESGHQIVSLSRRIPTQLKDSVPENVKTIINSDPKTWSEEIKTCEVQNGSTFFSGFGTTRAAAGSAEKFKEIDYGINIESFKAAKANGNFDTAILVSSLGANANSMFLYMKTKGELERDVKALGFKRTVILRPGILLGEREISKGWNNVIAEKIGSALRGSFLDSMIGTPIRGDEVAIAAKIIAESPIDDDKPFLTIDSKEIRDIAARGSML